MCNALDIDVMATFAYDLQSPGDWSDLVEYCWGECCEESQLRIIHSEGSMQG